MKHYTVHSRWFDLALRWRSFLVVVVLFVWTGCWTTRKDVSHQTPYNELVGTTWRLKEGLYIVEFVDGSGKPGVLSTASHATKGQETVVDAKNTGKTFLDTIIKGVLPKGTEIRVLSVIEEKTVENHSFDVGVRPLGELGDKWPKLIGYDIQESGWFKDEDTGSETYQVKMNTELVEQVQSE